MKADFKLEGMKELAALFRQLPDEIEKRELQKVMRSGARLLVKEVRQRAPRATGNLQKQIYATRTRSKKQLKEGAWWTVKVRNKFYVRPGQSEKTKRGYSNKRWPSVYARFLEFGTKKQPAQPFMRPAVEAKGQEVIAQWSREMYNALLASTSRLAGPLAASGLLKKGGRR